MKPWLYIRKSLEYWWNSVAYSRDLWGCIGIYKYIRVYIYIIHTNGTCLRHAWDTWEYPGISAGMAQIDSPLFSRLGPLLLPSRRAALRRDRRDGLSSQTASGPRNETNSTLGWSNRVIARTSRRRGSGSCHLTTLDFFGICWPPAVKAGRRGKGHIYDI